MSYVLLLLTLLDWGIRLVMIGVVLRRRLNPATSLAWLTIIVIEPKIGVLVYALVGSRRFGRKRVRLHRHVVVKSRAGPRLAAQILHVVRPEVDPICLPVIGQAEKYGGMPILGGNQVRLLRSTEETVEELVQAVDRAEQHAHLLFYIFRPDESGRRVAEALIRAAGRGVRCRLLVDDVGSKQLVRGPLWRELRTAGVQVRSALPVRPLRRLLQRMDIRNHRKLAVIDGRIALTGSQNIVNADYGTKRVGVWHDLMGVFQGPVVTQLQTVFLEDWAFETGEVLDEEEHVLPDVISMGKMAAQVVPTGPSHEEEKETIERVLMAAFSSAQRRIIITTPYLIPNESTILALSMAVDRGVVVDIVAPARVDHPLVQAAARHYYDELLEAGVNVHLHRDGLLHAKTITVDDTVALLGSTNLDRRSFNLNFEVNVLMYGPQIVSKLRFAQQTYIDGSTLLDAEAWAGRPSWRRYLQAFAALFSPLL
jgi:cardiolipin synthase A/B